MKNVNNSKLRIIPLGGLEQIGMNITAFEFEDSIVVVDCGLAFPEDSLRSGCIILPDRDEERMHLVCASVRHYRENQKLCGRLWYCYQRI